jgi:hypothetical protein
MSKRLARGAKFVPYLHVAGKSLHPYSLKVRPCTEHAGRFRWEILDNEVVDTSSDSFTTEREAEESGQREMKHLLEMWNKL